jgi:hypothetical protein
VPLRRHRPFLKIDPAPYFFLFPFNFSFPQGMSRPRSIYERFSSSTLPPPESRVRFHAVQQGESLISIANLEYSLAEYDPDLWRDMGIANLVQDPFTLDIAFRARSLRVLPRPLPDFK